MAVAAWPAAIPNLGAEPGPLTAGLGRVFDMLAAKTHRGRPVNNTWAPWAGRWLVRFHDCYYANWRAAPAAAPPAHDS